MNVIRLKELQSLIDGSAVVKYSSYRNEDKKVRLAVILMWIIDIEHENSGADAFLVHAVNNKIRVKYHDESAQRRVGTYRRVLTDAENPDISDAY